MSSSQLLGEISSRSAYQYNIPPKSIAGHDRVNKCAHTLQTLMEGVADAALGSKVLGVKTTLLDLLGQSIGGVLKSATCINWCKLTFCSRRGVNDLR